MTSYYSTGKRGTEGGIPIWHPKWYGELGNDAEFREATKPRTAFKAPYYEGGYRLTIDGVPIRLAPHVKGWKPCNKAALCKGTGNSNAFQKWDSRKGYVNMPAAVLGDLFASVPSGQLRIAA